VPVPTPVQAAPGPKTMERTASVLGSAVGVVKEEATVSRRDLLRAAAELPLEGATVLERVVVWWCGIPHASAEYQELSGILAAYGGTRTRTLNRSITHIIVRTALWQGCWACLDCMAAACSCGQLLGIRLVGR